MFGGIGYFPSILNTGTTVAWLKPASHLPVAYGPLCAVTAIRPMLGWMTRWESGVRPLAAFYFSRHQLGGTSILGKGAVD